MDNLRGRNNAFNIAGPRAAGTVISGFTIEHATFEGIIARKTSHLTISHNVIKSNDLGLHAKQPTGECAAQGPEPGDCGEGIHLLAGHDSTITGNRISATPAGSSSPTRRDRWRTT